MATKRFAIPMLFSWIVLAISLSFTSYQGWSNTQERQLDWYSGLALNGFTTCQIFPPEREATTISIFGSACVPTAYRFPVYPLVLDAMLHLFGGEPGARVFQSVLAALLMFLCCGFTLRVGGNPFITGIALTASWALYFYSSLIQTELLFTFLSVLLLIAMYRAKPAVGGALTGLTLLTRGSFLFVVPLLFLFFRWRIWLRYITAMVLVLSVWWVRNLIQLHAFVPFSTGSGLVLLGANNSWVYANMDDGLPDGGWTWPLLLPVWPSLEHLPELEKDQAETSLAVNYAKSQPPAVLASVVLARFENWWGREDTARGTVIIFFGSVALFVAFKRMRRRFRYVDKRALNLCIAFILGTIMNGIVFWAGVRFRMPAEPFLAIVAGLLFVRPTPLSKSK